MNRSSLIFLLSFLLLLSIVFVYNRSPPEGYTASATSIARPTATPTAEDLELANQHYAGLLLFLKKYPDRSIPFIKDIQSKFFTDACIVKPSISFDSLAQFPNGMLFV
jgi:hypothetical protein